MSVQAITWVFENSKAKGNDRLVMLSIANHASKDRWDCFPGVALVAEEAFVSHRTAQRCLANLVESGELEVIVQGAPVQLFPRFDRRPNLYRMTRNADGVSDCHPVPDGSADSSPLSATGTANPQETASSENRETLETPTNKLSTGGVSDCHPVEPRGDRFDATGCQIVRHGVTPVSPKPSTNHQLTSSSQIDPSFKDLPDTAEGDNFRGAVDEVLDLAANKLAANKPGIRNPNAYRRTLRKDLTQHTDRALVLLTARWYAGQRLSFDLAATQIASEHLGEPGLRLERSA